MRPVMAPRGSVKQLADKMERPAAPTPPRPPPEKTGSVKNLKNKFEKRVDPSIRETAIKRMVAIADRAGQETTKQQNFAKKVETEKKKRRGGAPGDVVPLGKRKEPEPDLPLSILRKQPAARTNTKQRIYGPRTQVFDIGVPAY